MRALPAALFLLSPCVLTGCGKNSGEAPVEMPTYNADAIVAAALKQLDKNGNGTLEENELNDCPGLKAVLNEIDKNRDRKLNAEELRERFVRYDQGAEGGGPVSVGCQVTLDGPPLSGATVRFVPEPFMADVLKPAAGTTDDSGYVSLKLEGQSAHGVPPGLYKITVTRADGKPLPARYNTNTIYGKEVFEGGRGSSGSISLNLNSN